MPTFTEMEYFASLPATASDIAVAGNGAGASPDDHLTPSPARAVATEEHYFQSIDLDEQPHPLQEVWLNYPAHAVALDLQGWVRLLLLIDETGQIRHLQVLDASPKGIFDEAALDAFRFVPFAPAKRAGLAVKSRMTLKVDFKLGQGVKRKAEAYD